MALSLFQSGQTESVKQSWFPFGTPAAATSATATQFTYFSCFGASAAAAPATTQAHASKSLFTFGSSASQSTRSFGSFSAPIQTPFGFGPANTEPLGTLGAPAAPLSTPFGRRFGGAASTPAAAIFGSGSPVQSTTASMFNPTPWFNFGSTVTPSAATAAPGMFTFSSASTMQAMSKGLGTLNAPSLAATNEPPASGAGFEDHDVSASAAAERSARPSDGDKGTSE